MQIETIIYEGNIKPTVFAGLLVPDSSQFSGVNKGSFNVFTNAVAQANAAIDHVKGTAVGTKLLVVPEYYFSDMGGAFTADGSAPTPLSRGDKHSIYGKLKTLSSQYADLLIVAGSIFYQKGGTIRSKKGYNVVPVLYNGHLYHKYYKKMDDGNLKNADAEAEWNYKEKNPVFQLNGITFGLEVCGENSDPQHSLQKWVQNSGGPRVDVHIWLAGTTGHSKTNFAARVDGYCLHCDLLEGRNIVEKVTGTEILMGNEYAKSATPEAFNYQSAALANGSKIDVYQLAL